MAGLNYMEGIPQKGHTSGEDDANSVEDDSTQVRAIKNEPFAHMYHDDENDPAYHELREELDAIFQNSQLQDITDLPANCSLVSLPLNTVRGSAPS